MLRFQHIGELVGKHTSGPFRKQLLRPPVFLLEDSEKPIFLEGSVLHGYQRGGKLLDCATANISSEHYQHLLESLECGIYFGWATLNRVPPVYKAVISIGWNPVFNNTEKSIEAHLLTTFKNDFYDQHLRLLILGFIRKEAKFPSVEVLKQAIAEDKQVAVEVCFMRLSKGYDVFLFVGFGFGGLSFVEEESIVGGSVT
eukprot:jgi/Galph1/478/GphlegSOOS_G5165.1